MANQTTKLPIKTITAIITIALLIAFAMWQNIDGALLGIAIASIAGLGGYEIGYRKKSK